MHDSLPSTTALAVSLIRAAHSRSAPAPIIDDTWGEKLVPDEVVSRIAQSLFSASDRDTPAPSAEDVKALLLASPAYANVVVRSRFTEGALQVALARGVSQYVLIGAGLDSYALRMPPAAQDLSVFEVDHPATQRFKTEQIADAGIAVPDSVRFLPADLAQQSLGSVLDASDFDRDQPAFFSLLGVTMYLTPQANRDLMQEIANCSAPGSELVFTYVDEILFSADPGQDSAPFDAMQDQVSSQGEPFVSGFDPKSLKSNLEKVGLQLLEDVSDVDLIERYDPEGINNLSSVEQSRIARAGT